MLCFEAAGVFWNWCDISGRIPVKTSQRLSTRQMSFHWSGGVPYAVGDVSDGTPGCVALQREPRLVSIPTPADFKYLQPARFEFVFMSLMILTFPTRLMDLEIVQLRTSHGVTSTTSRMMFYVPIRRTEQLADVSTSRDTLQGI